MARQKNQGTYDVIRVRVLCNELSFRESDNHGPNRGPDFFPSEIPAQPGKDGLPGLGVFSLLWGSAFGATAHDAAHDAFMTLPHHTRTREGEVHHLGCGPQSCRVGLCV